MAHEVAFYFGQQDRTHSAFKRSTARVSTYSAIPLVFMAHEVAFYFGMLNRTLPLPKLDSLVHIYLLKGFPLPANVSPSVSVAHVVAFYFGKNVNVD